MMEQNNNIDVSVVIVCMNNYQQLKNCLVSIKEYTQVVSYEVLLVAYFFSEENLTKIRDEFPWVKVIVSDEIRGFSANNNLALRQAQGRYCFVLNDDTYMTMPVIDLLVRQIKANSNITLLSPQILRPDGSVQYSGIPPINWVKWLRIIYKIDNERIEKDCPFIQYKGLFKTYNILGAAFLIKTDVFRELGFFDEYYFFGPEDKALSTLLNKKGYECWIDADIKITHLGGATGGPLSKTVEATRPAERKGSVRMYSEGKNDLELFLSLMIFVYSAFLLMVFAIKSLAVNETSSRYALKANYHVCCTIFSRLTPLDIFKKYYNR